MEYVCGFDKNGFLAAGCVYKDETSLSRPAMLNCAVVLLELVDEETFELYKRGYYRNAEGVPTKPEVVEPTPEEQEVALQAQYTALIQSMLDKEAQKLGYDNCNSVCTYVDTGVQKFDDEGCAFRAWRSAVWAKGYEILDAVKAGEMEIPTEERLVEMLPKLVIEYTESV